MEEGTYIYHFGMLGVLNFKGNQEYLECLHFKSVKGKYILKIQVIQKQDEKKDGKEA